MCWAASTKDYGFICDKSKKQKAKITENNLEVNNSARYWFEQYQRIYEGESKSNFIVFMPACRPLRSWKHIGWSQNSTEGKPVVCYHTIGSCALVKCKSLLHFIYLYQSLYQSHFIIYLCYLPNLKTSCNWTNEIYM